MVWPAYGDWIIDTQELSKQLLGTGKLQQALEAAGIINFRPHSALSDAMSTVKLLQWLAQQDSDITLNTGQLFIYPSGLPKPRRATPTRGLAAASAQPRRSGGCYLRSLRSTANVALTLP